MRAMRFEPEFGRNGWLGGIWLALFGDRSRQTGRVGVRARITLSGLCLGVLTVLSPMSAGAQPDQPRASTPYPGGVWQPNTPQYGARTVNTLTVTMDDGVVLQTTVTYPTDPMTGERAAGRFPVVVEHSPYGGSARTVEPNLYLVEHGYIYAVVRARGTGGSQGDLSYFGDRDGQDGRAIIRWASTELDGGDGRVALVGCSWPGGLALTNAAHVGPNSPVRAVIAACVGLTGLQRQTLMVSGVPTTRGRTFEGLINAVGNTPTARETMSALLADIMAGGDMAYERAYWRERRPITHAQRIVDNGIPVLLWTGWQDYVDTGAVRTYIGLQNAHAGRPLDAAISANQELSPRYQIIVSGLGHNHGLNSALFLQWLETWVKGVDTGMQRTQTPMHVYEAGTGRWTNIGRYPIVSEYTRWQFGPSGALTLAGGARASQTIGFGDPAEDANRLTFTTAPIEEGATLGGPISATIHASSSNTNLLLVGILYDVAPDGSKEEISRGAILGSQRALDRRKTWYDSNGVAIWPWQRLERDEYLTPGRVYRMEMLLSPRQWGIRPNHRLQFEITTQSPAEVCPRDGIPNSSGTAVCGLTAPQQATVPGGVYTLMFGGNTPSTLNLPQLEFEALPQARAAVPPAGWNIGHPPHRNSPLPVDW